MQAEYSQRSVFVVSIPHDSASVRCTYVFENKEDAEEYCNNRNSEGYNGYCGGLAVEECLVIKKLKR